MLCSMAWLWSGAVGSRGKLRNKMLNRSRWAAATSRASPDSHEEGNRLVAEGPLVGVLPSNWQAPGTGLLSSGALGALVRTISSEEVQFSQGT